MKLLWKKPKMSAKRLDPPILQWLEDTYTVDYLLNKILKKELIATTYKQRMNKALLIFSLAVLGVLSGCTKDINTGDFVCSCTLSATEGIRYHYFKGYTVKEAKEECQQQYEEEYTLLYGRDASCGLTVQ